MEIPNNNNNNKVVLRTAILRNSQSKISSDKYCRSEESHLKQATFTLKFGSNRNTKYTLMNDVIFAEFLNSWFYARNEALQMWFYNLNSTKYFRILRKAIKNNVLNYKL